MKHLDLFSGYAGFSIASKELGIETIGFSEIEKNACNLLKYRFPKISNFGDITKVIIDSNDNVWYPSYDERSKTIREICGDSGFIQSGIVDPRYSEYLWSNETSNARRPQSEESKIQGQQAIRKGESFLQRENDGKRQKSERPRKSVIQRNSEAENPLRDMQGHGGVQRRKDENTGSPSRLQQAPRCDVALSEMSSQMAQESQSNTIKNLKGTRPNNEYRYSKLEDFDLLTGGFP